MSERLGIPEEKRHLFAQPLDTLIAGTREETISKVVDKFKTLQKQGEQFNFYIVGDIVTKDFLADEFLRKFIRLCIIDEKTQRNKITISHGDFFEEIREFDNPKGMIAKKSWQIIKESIRSEKRTLLRVKEGEEDLLVLPLIISLPLQEMQTNFVFYGQPPLTSAIQQIPEGLVMVEVTKKIQKVVHRFLKVMEKLS
ncbi:MAG: hypothetical protein BAJALOKI1v1_250010 [Promethearchaeota archaeon]|nr:MAG: hypothetical protein BAJALOKI1v1_250010 [Candidatus Lokiarchaeota archaeon]